MPNQLADATTQDESSSIGCDLSKNPWCSQLKPVNMWIYYISYVLLIGIAFPTINVTMNTLYSQIIGARRQVSVRWIQFHIRIAGHDAGRIAARRQCRTNARASAHIVRSMF